MELQGMKSDPKGPFAVIFNKDNGIDEFLRHQELINDLILDAVDDCSCKRGCWLRNNALMTKNPKVGRGWRQLLSKLPPSCQAEIAQTLFEETPENLLSLNDADLGKRAKERLRPTTVVQRADKVANRILAACRQSTS